MRPERNLIGESNIMAAQNPVRVLVWDEAPRHAPKELYPASINGAIAAALNEQGAGQIVAETANLDEANQGITAEKLKNYDVLLWWGHARHGEVKDEVAAIVKQAVHEDGLGFIPLHSGHYSKAFKAVLEATGDLKGGWREIEGFEAEEITVCAPRHPIAQGVEEPEFDTGFEGGAAVVGRHGVPHESWVWFAHSREQYHNPWLRDLTVNQRCR